ncbi:winged helix-turn-helix transcriptional regulator [Stappia sp. F7233]|uniref:Winged helix-turn-helix transcriptional regulator n=1 Tax=Stappia albiluteola TaxID=2758565 RepID=A0A839AA11_9HYPH|nr:MarR family transcriptional regulator [Stappia albiluteola]MBA5775955.1 winged helix-turn-helix transcriptional regulator [Stappia albiluteola]
MSKRSIAAKASSALPAEDGLDYGILNDLVGHLLRHAFLRGQQVFAAVFDGDGVTPLQFMVLELVSRNPGITHRAAAGAVGAAPSVLTTAMKPLIDEELVTRVLVPGDGRKVGYALSESGMERFAAIREKIRLAEARLTAPLGQGGRAELRAMLKKLTGRDGA